MFLTSFHNDPKDLFVKNWHRYLQRLPKIEVCFLVLEWQHGLSYLTETNLNDVIDNFNFENKTFENIFEVAGY